MTGTHRRQRAGHGPIGQLETATRRPHPFGMTARWPDQIGAILAVTAVILGLITRSRVSPVSTVAE